MSPSSLSAPSSSACSRLPSRIGFLQTWIFARRSRRLAPPGVFMSNTRRSSCLGKKREARLRADVPDIPEVGYLNRTNPDEPPCSHFIARLHPDLLSKRAATTENPG